jgi:hypothetical protein
MPRLCSLMVNVIPDTFVVDVPVTKSPWPILSVGCDFRSSTEECLGLARSSLENCINTHKKISPAVQKLPKRVVALDPHSCKIKLKETANGDRKYAALSYCWGPHSWVIFTPTPQSLLSCTQDQILIAAASTPTTREICN